MKKTVLVLLALLSLIPFAQSMAQTLPANPAAAPAPDTAAQFLATLAGGQTQAAPNDLAPAPSFMTGCTTTAQCPAGQLCCNVCGNPPVVGSEVTCRACVTPIRGRCPLVV
ncbi:MAG TPA: hypothetical protein VF173_07670 [Thermoanaerobaculia bacterium]|nr:hypothetical protein [Thermoanaerobaculia bacterium]